MNLKIEDLMREIALPKRYFNNNFTISEKFSEEKEKFSSLVKQYKGDEFDEDKKKQIEKSIPEIIKVADQVSDNILAIFEDYEKTDYKSTQELMDELMKQLEKDIFIGSIDDQVCIDCNMLRIRGNYDSRFFRIRAVDYESPAIQKNADELFHIPLSKRAYSNNERFSLVGFPSLYLSTMLPLAWQECGYPQKYYYSEYQYKNNADLNSGKRSTEDELKFLLLYSPSEIDLWGRSVKLNNFALWLEVLTRYLKTYPLILACSFVNQSGKVPYKQEYIIPQMLMQWVKRNSSEVQGIEYFTCADKSMWTSEWCAYNIVIPTLSPYDEQEYSIPLKEEFCWTSPQFYSVPILDKSYNEADRVFIYNLISDITNAMGISFCPFNYYETLMKINNICKCLMSLLENQCALDMQLVLQILNVLSENISGIKQMQLDKNIETEMKEGNGIKFVNESELEKACISFNKIYDSLLGNKNSSECIEQIIRKYENLCWNVSPPHSEVTVLCNDDSEINESTKWLKENHILHNVFKVDSSAESLVDLKKIASEAEIPLEDIWDSYVDDDEWLKDNIDKIKTPIFIKFNEEGIYSNREKPRFETVSIGFDKNILNKKLVC